MGAEPLYVISIIATLEKDGRRVSAEIADLDSEEVGDIAESHEGTRARGHEPGPASIGRVHGHRSVFDVDVPLDPAHIDDEAALAP